MIHVYRIKLNAGEHTCKEHPDTVGGAMLTGMREAIRVFHMLKGEEEFGKAAAALVDKDAVRKRKKVIIFLSRKKYICGGQAQTQIWN